MSTILKALRRLEEDKRAQAAMSLDQAVLDPAAPASPRRGIGLGVAAGVMAALGVIAIAWSLSGLWLTGGEGGLSQIQASSAKAAPPALETPSRVVKRDAGKPPGALERIEDAPRPPPVDPIPLTPSTAAARVEVFANPDEIRGELQRLVGGSARQVDASGPDPATAAAPDPEPAALVARQLAEDVAAKKSAPAPVAPKRAAKAPAPEPVAVAKALIPAPAAVSAPVPEPVAEPSVAVIERKPPPEIVVREIIWHPNPARRIAVVELDGVESDRLAEGDEIAGFTIAEIGLSDVELVRDGVTTKRRIGSK